jgi:hypothetical protein
MMSFSRCRKIVVLSLLAVALVRPAGATIYYVSQTGNDKANGTSLKTAFQTPQRGVNAASKPGDIVTILPGSTPYGGGTGVTPPIVLTASGSGPGTVAGGSCSKPITIEGYSLAATKPVIAGVQGAASAGAIYGLNVSCIVITGLELAGWNQNLSWASVSANAAASGLAWQNPTYTDYGVFISGTTAAAAHHIVLNNLYVHDFPGGGIGFIYGDYMSVLQSIVTGNALYSPFQGSGISLYQNKATDTTSTTHNVVSANFVSGNIVEVPSRLNPSFIVPALDSPAGTTFLNVYTNIGINYTQLVLDVPAGCIPPNTTVYYFGAGYIGLSQPTTCAVPSTDSIFYNYSGDGEGIIIDNSSESQTATGGIAYPARTLVINNITANNGGAGIACGPISAHCDIVYNTSYLDQAGAYSAGNSNSPGAISIVKSYDVSVYNNIIVAGPSVAALWNDSPLGVKWSNNLVFGGVATNYGHPIPGGGNIIGQDPLFVAPGSNPATANFQLQPGSPAIGAGSSLFTRNLDYGGNTVTTGNPVDIGAYEAPSN